MGSFDLLPVGDKRNDGWVIVNASALYDAWNNNDDTKYAKCPGTKGRGEISFPVDTTSVPEGAVITSITVFLRCSKTTGTPSITVELLPSDVESRYHSRTLQPTSSIATYEVGTYRFDPLHIAWDVHRLNKIRCRVWSPQGIVDAIRCHKFYCRVNYRTRPTVTVTDPAGTVRTPSPVVAWTYVQDDADLLGRTEYKIFTTAQTSALSFSPDTSPAVYAGSVTGDTTSQLLPTSLNPDSYTVYVRSYSTYGARSLWASKSFEVQGPAPAVPGNDNAVSSGVPGVGTVSVVADSYGSAAYLTARDASNLMSVQGHGAEVAADPLEMTGSGCSIDRDTVTVYTPGLGAFKITNTVAGTMTMTSSFGRVAAGTPVTIAGQIRSAVTARTATLAIEFFDSGFTSLGAPSITASTTDSASTWKSLSTSGTSPAGAVWFKLSVTVASAALSEVHYADMLGVMYGTGSAVSSGGHMSRNLLTAYQATADDPAVGSLSAPFVAGNSGSTYAIASTSGTGSNGSKTHRMTYAGISPSIAFRATGTSFSSPTSGNDFTLNKPAGLADNDLMLAFITTTTPSTITPPSGWALADFTSAEGNNGLYILKRTGLAADPSTWAGTFSSLSSRRYAVVVAWSGAAPAADQFIASNVRADSDGSPVHTTTSVINTDQNAWRVAAFCARDDAGSGTFTANTSPSVTPPDPLFVGRGTKWSRGTNGTDFTINRPAGVASGDLMVASVITNGNLTATTPTGWTSVRRTMQTDSGTAVTMFVYKRTAGSSEPSSWSSTLSGSTKPCLTQSVAWRNVKDASLQFALENSSTDDSGSSISTPVLNNTSSRCVRMEVFGALTPFAGSWYSTETNERADDYQTAVYDVAMAMYDSGSIVATGNTYNVGYSTQSYYGAIAWIGMIVGLDTPPAGATTETERRDGTVGSSDPWQTLAVYDSNAAVPVGPTTLTGTFSNSTPTSVLSWVGLIKPAAASVSGDVAADLVDLVDISAVDDRVLELASNKVTVMGSFLGSAPGTPFLTLKFYRANQWISTSTAEGSSYGTSVWTESSATFDLPSGCTRIGMSVSSRDRAVSDTVSFDRLGISFGSEAVWRNGTSRAEHPVWSYPEIQYADDDGTGYGEWAALPGVKANPPAYVQETGVVTYTDHTVVPLHNRKYRVQTVSYGLNGDRFVSGWGPESDEVSFTALNWWLKDISDPSSNLLLCVKSEPTAIKRVGTSSKFLTMGAKKASVVGDGYKGDEFTLTLETKTSEQYAELYQLLVSERTLFLVSDVDKAWWLRIYGDLDEAIQVTGKRKTRPLRFITVNYVEVESEE